MTETAVRIAGLCVNVSLAIGLAGCATSRDKVILLPDETGTTGQVIVRTATHEQVLDRPYDGVIVAGAGALERTRTSAEDVSTRYRTLFDAQPPRPATFTLRFLFDSATQLVPGSASIVRQIRQAVAGWPAPHVLVVGHTDMTGSDEHNDRLSLMRARSVAGLIMGQGVSAADMEIVGRGRREPLADTPDGAPNRRVVVTIQ